MKEAEQLSERLDKETQRLCSNNPTSDACRAAISSQIQYIAMQDAWSVMRNDVSRTSNKHLIIYTILLMQTQDLLLILILLIIERISLPQAISMRKI